MGYYSIALAFAAAILILSQTVVVVILAYGQISSTRLFGCQRYGDSMHCDLLLNEMEAYETIGNSTLINPLTSNDTLFVDGTLVQALAMRGEYRESIEIKTSPELNPRQSTVAFWGKSTNITPY